MSDEPAVLMEDWTVVIDGCEYVVPAGFESDGCSIPRGLQRICGSSMQTPRLYAAIWHDAAYSGLFGASRAEADRGYRDLLVHIWHIEPCTDGRGHEITGIYARIRNTLATVLNLISAIVAEVEYLALRLFGWSHYTTERMNYA